VPALAHVRYSGRVTLSISPEALQLIRARSDSVHLELPAAIATACCAQSFQERPTVRFGPPPDAERKGYLERSIGGLRVFMPPDVELQQRDLKLVVSSFLWVKRVVLEGWWPV
jgi:hypothetical protein